MLEGSSDDDITVLYQSSEPYYRQAHLTIDTTSRTVDQVVSDLVAAVRAEHARV